MSAEIEFHQAIERGQTDLVSAMLALGFDVNAPQSYGFDGGTTPLMMAAGVGDPQMLAFLLSRGAEVNTQHAITRESALFLAVKHSHSDPGRIATLRLLLAAGANPNVVNHNGLSPLYFAQDAETIALLLDYGADPDASDKHPPVIEHATDPERLRLLLEAGGNPNVVDVWGRSALHAAAAAGAIASVRQLLAVMNPVVVRSAGVEQDTALDAAAQGGYHDAVRLLLAHGFMPTERMRQITLDLGYLRSARLLHQALGGGAWPALNESVQWAHRSIRSFCKGGGEKRERCTSVLRRRPVAEQRRW